MDLQSFDLNLLLGFDAIYRHQNLSAAGHELNLTQPAVSAALRRMRVHFGNPLFVRTSRGMRPTPFADDIAPKIAQVLEMLRGVDQSSTFTPATSSVHFRVYINDVGLIVLMPLLLTHLRDHAPHTRLTIVDLRPDEVVEALDAGSIDLAIGYFLGMPNWAHQQTLRNTRYVCLMRRDHPVVGDSLSLEQFLGCRHAMYASSGSLHHSVEHALAQMNLTRDVALTVPRFAALPFLVERSDLIVTVPEDLGQLFSGLINVKQLPPPLKLANFQIKHYWHDRLHAEPAYIWLRQAVWHIMNKVMPQPTRVRRAG